MDTCFIKPLFKFSKLTKMWYKDAKVSSDKKSLSLTLVWSMLNNSSDPIDHCNIYTSTSIEDIPSSSPWQSQLVFLGRAYGTSFRVNDLKIFSAGLHKNTLSLKFHVQPVTVSRLKVNPKDSPELILKILP